MPTPLYTIDAHYCTRRDAADAFAREWFAEPREVEWMDSDGRFGLVDGDVTYKVLLVRGALGDCYEVVRLDDPKGENNAM